MTEKRRPHHAPACVRTAGPGARRSRQHRSPASSFATAIAQKTLWASNKNAPMCSWCASTGTSASRAYNGAPPARLSGSLRGPLMARPAPTCAVTLIASLFLQHLRLQAAQRKKEKPPDHRRNQHCRPSGAGCLITWHTPSRCDVRAAGPASPWLDDRVSK